MKPEIFFKIMIEAENWHFNVFILLLIQYGFNAVKEYYKFPT